MDGKGVDYMIKYRVSIVLACLSIFYTVCIGSGKSDVLAGSEFTLPYENITKVVINAGGPSYLEHQKYDYTTSLKNEVVYILNYINNFHLKADEMILNVNDTGSYSVNIYMNDGSTKKCGFYAGRFYDDYDKQYAIDRDEYNRFLDFVHALKTKKIILNDEVTFEPSEWAKSDVDKAVQKGLVPGLNQINYKGKVNRLEVCQLIDNLLNKKNITKAESTENPFSDTTDKSVTSLYNLGIIDGKNESEFIPYADITREELSKILSNIYYLINQKVQSNNNLHEYEDQEEISPWALDYVSDMYSLNIMIGNQENKFKPHDSVTKEELIIALLKIYM